MKKNIYNKKSICFILPSPKIYPVGGYKIVYEYANYLANNNFDIHICYLCKDLGKRFNIPKIIKKIYGMYLLSKFKWFNLNKQIIQKIVLDLNEISNVNAYLYIGTAIQTFDYLKRLNVNLNNKLYFIQGLENWNDISLDYVYDSYRYPIKKVVVSKWLYGIVNEYDSDENIFLCSNGIDTSKYSIHNNINFRNNKSISFMFDKNFVKGSDILEHVIIKLIIQYPDIVVNAFGKYHKPKFLRDKDLYIYSANTEQIVDIYNNSAIFITTSREEGFGLTGLESMACGCALVTTKTNGSKEYTNFNNSVLCDIDDVDEIYNAVIDLINNNEKRIEIAKKGNLDAQSFDIEKSKEKFCHIIKTILNIN